MWQCPKCKREFKNQNQNHSCGESTKTIDAYIDAQSEDIQLLLNLVRGRIKSALPDAQEKISWGMPTYWKKQNIIHFAASKKHIGLYPGEEAVRHFADQIKDYKSSKGAIQFPYDKEIPLDLIEEIAIWCYKTGNHH